MRAARLAGALAAVCGCGGAVAEGAMDANDAAADAADVNLDQRTESGATARDAGDGGSSDAGDGGGRALVQIVGGAPWGDPESAAQIAVDHHDRVYVLDSSMVYVVIGSTIQGYMSVSEAQAIAGAPMIDQLRDLDIASDDTLLILLDHAVIQSTAAHTGIVLHSWTSSPELLNPSRLGVIAPSRAVVTDNHGLHTVTASGSLLVYDAGQVQSGQGCVVDDLAMSYSGAFLYQVGCNGSPLLTGNVNGSGVATLYRTAQQGPFDVQNFECTARDPAGGFYSLVSMASTMQPSLYHIAANAMGGSGPVEVPTVPSLVQAKQQAGNGSLAFDFCSLAVAVDGNVFIKTADQLWRLAP
jgi:hypothetical protein